MKVKGWSGTIKAKYENGVLFIDIPKKEKEIPISHNIEIE